MIKSKPRILIYLLIIYLLGLLAYFNSFNGEFVFDDRNSIVLQEKLKEVSDITGIWNANKSRFIPYFTYAINYRLDKFNPLGYHAVNFTIHLFNSFLVFFLTSIILKTPLLSKNKFPGSGFLPIYAALIFTVHPALTQAVNFISQRSALFACFFYLSALYLYICSRLLKNKKKSLIYYFLSLSALFLALVSKENTYTLPLIILFSEFFLFPDKIKNFPERILGLIPFFLLTGFVFFIIYLQGNVNPVKKIASINMLEDARITRKEYLLTQTNVIRRYLGLLIVPINQNIDYDFPIARNFTDINVLISSFIIILLIISSVILYKKNPLITYGIIFFFTTLSVESSIIPIKDVIYEHRLYLPSFGFFIAILSLLGLIKNTKIIYIFFLPILAIFILMTINRNKIWNSEYSLWKDASYKSIGKARVHYNLGVSGYRIGKTVEAKNEFIKTLELDPDYSDAYRNLGFIYEREGNSDKTLDLYINRLNIDPEDTKVRAILASFYAKKGQYNDAVKQYLRILEYDPLNSEVYNDLGIIYLIQNDKSNAVSNFAKATALSPRYENAYLNLANTYYHFGDDISAKKYYLEVLKIRPGNDQAIYNLNNINGRLAE